MYPIGFRNPYVSGSVTSLEALDTLWGNNPKDTYYLTAKTLLVESQYRLVLVRQTTNADDAQEMDSHKCIVALELGYTGFSFATEPYYIPVVYSVDERHALPTMPAPVQEISFFMYGQMMYEQNMTTPRMEKSLSKIDDEKLGGGGKDKKPMPIPIAAVYLAWLLKNLLPFRSFRIPFPLLTISDDVRQHLDANKVWTYNKNFVIPGVDSVNGLPLQLILAKSIFRREVRRVLSMYIGLENTAQVRSRIRNTLSQLVEAMRRYEPFGTAYVVMTMGAPMNSDDSPVVNAEVHIDAFAFVIHVQLDLQVV